MKTTPVLLLGLLLGASTLVAAPPAPITELQFTWADPDDPALADVRIAGEAAIQHMGNQLIRETSRVLADQGAEAALDVLHLKSLVLPAASPGKPPVTAVKRTSLRVRRFANAPDNADLAALISIQKELMDGNNAPKVLIQHVAAAGALPAEWRVYRPISVAPACLVCHGPPESLQPAVKTKLDRLFPEDKAVNYAAYDWRGVIRVSVADVPPPAKKP